MKYRKNLANILAISLFSLMGLGSLMVLPSNAQSASDSDLEIFLGLSSGSLDGLGNGDATVGSAIRQTFSGSTGQTLTFDWNFLTDENTPSFAVNDFAFVSISPLGGSEILADTNSLFSDEVDNTPFSSETGFNAFSFVLPEDGTYTLGIGVVDVTDTFVDSGLLIDNVSLVNNGNFETGDFSSWATIGVALIEDSSFGSGPTGSSQAFITTAPEPTTLLGTGFVLGLGILLKRKMRRRTA